MRVAVFTDSYRPYTSGVVRSIETFSEELEALGHRVYIFAPRYGLPPGQESDVFRFYSVPTPTNREFNVAIPISLRLKPTLKQLGVDVVHVHSPFLLGRLGVRCAQDLGLPSVFTYHTLYDHYVHYIPVARDLTRKITQHLCVHFCNRCDQVLVPTNVIGDYIRELGVQVPVRKLPTGIRLDHFQSGDAAWFRDRLGIGPEEKVLLFVGRLGQEKNLEFLLRAYARARGRLGETRTRLVLIGSGPEDQNLALLAADLGIAARVIIAGPVPSHEVKHCYAGSDLFVFPSVTETQGLVIGEAKAAGLPSVAVRAFGVTEMVEHGVDGFLTGLDEGDFADRVVQLLRNSELLYTFSARARENALKLSSRRMAEELVTVYMRLIRGQRRAGYSAQ